MMEPRIEWARQRARMVLLDLEVHAVDDLRDLPILCAGRGVAVTYEKLTSLEGMLIRSRRLIAVRHDIREAGRTRFAIAHELGHWELHPGLDQLRLCTVDDIQAYKGSPAELEANAFAAEFLMPDWMLTKHLKYESPTIASVQRLASHFQMSLTAAAVRFCQHTDLPVFVAFSSGGKLRWFQRSKRAEPHYFLPTGSPLSGESLARYCTDGPDESTKPVEVDSEAWFPADRMRHSFKVLEESVELGAYGVTLSIVTVDE